MKRVKSQVVYLADTTDFKYPVLLPSDYPVVHLLISWKHFYEKTTVSGKPRKLLEQQLTNVYNVKYLEHRRQSQNLLHYQQKEFKMR